MVIFNIYLFLSSTGRYRPDLTISYVASQLAFDEDSTCLAWLQELNVTFNAKDSIKIDCKGTVLP